MADEKDSNKEAEQQRARRIEETIRKGPRAPRNPREFVEEKMREERKREGGT